MPKPPFDPNKPFEAVPEAVKPAFDPSKPYESLDQQVLSGERQAAQSNAFKPAQAQSSAKLLYEQSRINAGLPAEDENSPWKKIRDWTNSEQYYPDLVKMAAGGSQGFGSTIIGPAKSKLGDWLQAAGNSQIVKDMSKHPVKGAIKNIPNLLSWLGGKLKPETTELVGEVSKSAGNLKPQSIADLLQSLPDTEVKMGKVFPIRQNFKSAYRSKLPQSNE